MADIMHLMTIEAPAYRVYEALTTAEGVRGWWTPDADLDPAVGGVGTFRFHDGTDVTTVRIESLEKPLRVHWKTIRSFRPEWVGTTITFDLRADDERTVLSFAHRGFKEADVVYALTTTGWGIYLNRLQEYLAS